MLVFAMALVLCLSWSGCDSGPSKVQRIVLAERTNPEAYENLNITNEDEIWLIEQLMHPDPVIRGRAGVALANSKSGAAPVVLYLAAKAENDYQAHDQIAFGLGRMGKEGRRFTVYLLESGVRSFGVLAAYAQARHADIARIRERIADIQVEMWWEEKGKDMLKTEKVEQLIVRPKPKPGRSAMTHKGSREFWRFMGLDPEGWESTTRQSKDR